ncbi:MAG: preprotein translocase subunit SecY, partial [Candidatus Saccharimonadales bacterium]|nr:preprotein translocase subunit SecY [Candidatus Saccharimonadales bacterium]
MSWKIIRQALKNPDMRKRLLWVAFLILIFRSLSFIPIPLAEPTVLRDLLDNLFETQQLLGFIDLLSGGALSNFSIVLMGLGPYINASIVMQLLTKAVPRLEEINEDGESGRRKINQYTRLLTLPFALLQSIGLLLLIRQQASSSAGVDLAQGADIFQWVLMIGALVGGSMLLMWMGELMTEQGVGNGISLLIFAGIISQLPSTVNLLISSVVNAPGQLSVFGLFTIPFDAQVLAIVGGILIATVALTYFVVKLNEAQRIITVSYAKRVRGNRAYGGVDTVLPIKLISAGVIPIIFAVAFLSVPNFIGQLMVTAESQWMQDFGANLLVWFQTPGVGGPSVGGTAALVYPIAYFLLVIAFTYFYTGIVFNAKQISENLQKQGGFIAGIRPGKQTQQYLSKIVNRLTLFGSIALGFVAVVPFIVEGFLGTSQLTIGGTGLLIVVAVAIETLRQVESRALM